MFKLLIPVVALLALAGGVAFWAYSQVDDSAEAGVEVVRWVNVTVAVPEGSGVAAVPGSVDPGVNPPDGGPVLLLVKGESRLAIDADTGKVIHDSVEASDRPAIDEVLATLEIREFDPDTAPWPYGTVPPATPRERFGNISFIRPGPESGLAVYLQVGDLPPGSEGSGLALGLTNGRSTLAIDAGTGAVFEETTKVAAEDQEAFDRFLSAIQFGQLGP